MHFGGEVLDENPLPAELMVQQVRFAALSPSVARLASYDCSCKGVDDFFEPAESVVQQVSGAVACADRPRAY